MSKVQKIKQHIKDNKKVYIASAGCLAVGVIGGILISTRSNSGTQIMQTVNQIGFRNTANPTIINLVENSTPSKPVHLVGTDLYFNSLNDCAKKTGHHLSQLSKHINGKLPDLNGDVFELLQPA
jgi:hypothetical protein